MLKLGNGTINKVMLGSTEINKVYLGSTVVYIANNNIFAMDDMFAESNLFGTGNN